MPTVRSRIPYKWIAATTFVVGLFMDIMDATIVNVTIPTLGREFKASGSTIEWVVVGYLLSLAVWIPASGWVGDRLGTKKVFLFALAAFTLTSALCGQAHSLRQLVVFRVLQGVGGGMMTPVGTAVLFRAFPPIERAKASMILMVPTVVAPAVGPVLGGWLVTYHSWRWIFYVNVPLGIAGFVFGALFLQEHREPTAGRFDAAGFVLSGVGLASILYALSEGPFKGWGSRPVLVTGVTGLVLFVVLVVVELRIDQPMLDLRLIGERMFRSANLVTLLGYSSFVGILFLLPQFLQSLRSLSAVRSGLTTFPQAIGVIVASQLSGRLYHRIGPRRMIFAGYGTVAVVSSTFVFLGLDTSLWLIRLVMFVRGIGMAFAFVPLQAATYANVRPAQTGRASALYSTTRQGSAALGVAILATVWVSVAGGSLAKATSPATGLHAIHVAFAAGAVLVALSAVSALVLMRDEDAAATMRGRQEGTPERTPDEPVAR